MHPKYYGRLTNTWVTDATIVKAINDIGVLPAMDLDMAKLNKGLTNHPKIAGTMIRFDGSNDCGIYRCNYVGKYFYYLTSTENKHVKCPPVATEKSLWVEKVLNAQASIFRPTRKKAPEAVTSTPLTTTTQAATVLKMRKHHHHRQRN
jgi:hypothetical protein